MKSIFKSEGVKSLADMANIIADTYEKSHFADKEDLANWIYSALNEVKTKIELELHIRHERIAKEKGWIK